MLDESTIVAKCANSVKPSKAGGSAAMAVSSVSRHAADTTEVRCLVCKKLMARHGRREGQMCCSNLLSRLCQVEQRLVLELSMNQRTFGR